MVAAWINALTGVGPSIASGSHTYSGICADLPVAPTKSNNAIVVSTGAPAASACALSAPSSAWRIPELAAVSVSPAEVNRIVAKVTAVSKRSEERRVGKEGSLRWSTEPWDRDEH